jgi:hypothetical protein
MLYGILLEGPRWGHDTWIAKLCRYFGLIYDANSHNIDEFTMIICVISSFRGHDGPCLCGERCNEKDQG